MKSSPRTFSNEPSGSKRTEWRRLLPALSSGKLENQRSVVKNERLQRIDNQPYGRVSEEMYSLLYDGEHPYHWPIIGWMEHLDAITIEDVRTFFGQYYTPSNAVVVLAGMFDRDQSLKWIEKYFGSIAAGPSVEPPTPRTPILRGEYRRIMDEPVALGRLDMLWPTVPRFHPDEAALDLASLILGDGKDSRLRRRLEREENSRTRSMLITPRSSLPVISAFGPTDFLKRISLASNRSPMKYSGNSSNVPRLKRNSIRRADGLPIAPMLASRPSSAKPKCFSITCFISGGPTAIS